MRSIFKHFADFRINYAIIALVVLVTLSVVFYYNSSSFVPSPGEPHQRPTIEISVATSSMSHHEVMPESVPGTLRIPKIDLSTSFVAPLGVDSRGEVEVPAVFDRVGWYKYSPTPGELGPSVILGHVDSKNGPAVFYDLDKLERGDEIYIEREDGSVATFIVETSEEYSQSAFPSDKVYGNIDHAGLRLVTCAGTYDHGIERYSHNLVVYARLATTTTADN